jgi:hypothetical protein
MSRPATPIQGKIVERMYVSKSGDTKFIYKPMLNSSVGEIDRLIEGQKYYFEYALRNHLETCIGMFWFATERTLVFFREDEPTLTVGIPISNIKYLALVKETEN